MSKRLYLNLFLSLLILLFGYNFASGLIDFWTIRIINILAIVLAGFFLIKFNPNLLPKKENSTFRIKYLFPIVIGIIGLFLATYFIPLLIYNLMEWEWTDRIRPTQSELPRYLTLLTVWAFLEEIYFRRIISQKLFNEKGLSKAIWISSLIFSIAHIFSDNGLFGAFIGGIALGYIYLKTKNIWLSILTHLAFNLTSFFVSPKLTKNLAEFNSYQKISLIIILSFGLILTMILIIKKQTNNKQAELKTSR
ncbi:CPBP family intramembrane glutamic endopeptidase [Algibacter pectinivorans]|uniref:CAAX protease self-immunity n=1 Tax=Algibacter pectinivorans TaxID=870482 RepID=A0A1I1S9W6_9FLAO|nr:CPBP family intramembrane glutamic endopeptidase [Algibacter pectinivorans]SFD43285.1 CAAX protease self-immunity [Algibacter pectinivorans]